MTIDDNRSGRNALARIDKQITRDALQLIRDANAMQYAYQDSYRSFDVRMVAMHVLFNVADHVLGLTGTRALLADHRKYSKNWREELHIRTCDDCGTHMHDMHAVPCESPAGHMFVFCETCAILNGFAAVCAHCTLAYAHEDMAEYIPHYLSESALDSADSAPLSMRVCIDCFPTLRLPGSTA